MGTTKKSCGISSLANGDKTNGSSSLNPGQRKLILFTLVFGAWILHVLTYDWDFSVPDVSASVPYPLGPIIGLAVPLWLIAFALRSYVGWFTLVTARTHVFQRGAIVAAILLTAVVLHLSSCQWGTSGGRVLLTLWTTPGVYDYDHKRDVEWELNNPRPQVDVSTPAHREASAKAFVNWAARRPDFSHSTPAIVFGLRSDSALHSALGVFAPLGSCLLSLYLYLGWRNPETFNIDRQVSQFDSPEQCALDGMPGEAETKK